MTKKQVYVNLKKYSSEYLLQCGLVKRRWGPLMKEVHGGQKVMFFWGGVLLFEAGDPPSWDLPLLFRTESIDPTHPYNRTSLSIKGTSPPRPPNKASIRLY